MRFSVDFYCPDSHLVYDRNILETQGVGGGITSRVRMAHALAALGHEVTLYVNCPKEGRQKGVEYRHFTDAPELGGDVLVASTSGGTLDLSPLHDIPTNVRLSILMAHGLERPKGIQNGQFNYLYALSNFMRKNSAKDWGFENAGEVFVSHRGVVDSNGRDLRHTGERDPFQLGFVGHPSKGLANAVSVLKGLLAKNGSFHLHVFGGPELWGESAEEFSATNHVEQYGVLGQAQLREQLKGISFAIFIQSREEPFGLSLIESMKAGCIVIASPVGAFPEIIQNEVNGFLLKENSNEAEQVEEAVEIILDCLGDSERRFQLRTAAAATPNSWTTIAKAWTQHWEWALSTAEETSPMISSTECSECGSPTLGFADGFHCVQCGNYLRPQTHA